MDDADTQEPVPDPADAWTNDGRPAERLLTPEDIRERFWEPMVRLAYLVSGSPEDAEDACQEVFVRLGSRPEPFQRAHSPDSYLRRAVINEVRGIQRTRRREDRRRARLQAEPTRSDPQGDVRSDPQADVLDAVWDAIAALSHRQREALILRYHEDLSEVEAAKALGCTRRALNSLVSRALAEVRWSLREREERAV